MAAHSSVLAWGIPGTGKPGGLPSMGSHSQTRLKRLSSSSSSIELSIELGKRNKIHACKLAHMTKVTLHINKERKQYSINGAPKVFIFIIYTFLLEDSCLTMLCAPKFYIA